MPLEHRKSRSRASSELPISLDAVVAASSTDLTPDELSQAPALLPSPVLRPATGLPGDESAEDRSSNPMPPPPQPSETFETRSVRSTSTASRNANRLSLTLPIAPPNSLASRPTPTSSVPPTPADTSVMNSPVDPNDFIIAIAAQERRVLELREELGRAEEELKRLQKQWAIAENYRKRPSNRSVEPFRPISTAVDSQPANDESPAVRRSSELDRRKAILRAQSQGATRVPRRTIIRGGHTRALSLLSPTKPRDDISIHEDTGLLRSPGAYLQQQSPLLSAPLNKRATWAPRQTPPQNGMKQMASDFKQGLWTFVEDLRQATVGDEAISHRTSDMASRLNRADGGQDTIRASSANRGRIPLPSELDSNSDNQSRSSTASFNDRIQHRRTSSKPEPKARKHFSWQPLMFDNFDDEDWSNWDSPSVKTSRWSGSTVNGDIISAIPEKTDESEATLRRKRSQDELRSPTPQTPSKLDELPQAILNRLNPSNLKNSTSNFIKEWEKSLSPPEDSANYDSSLQELRTTFM
ncbi:hypothetical protein F4780DRAFT_798772 [Xylariomycetidae sp. FL0641]|nr:hypothetical protein F4780DRAFT_798772 [Xylariomycetidae sp. FL0641]